MITKGIIPPRVHGLIAYAVAIVLIAAPFVLGFDSDTATWLSVGAGVAVALVEACTDWSTGVIKAIPPSVHGIIDYALAIALIAAPFVFGFDDDDEAMWFFVVMGAAALVFDLATRFVHDEGSRRVDSTAYAEGGRPVRR